MLLLKDTKPIPGTKVKLCPSDTVLACPSCGAKDKKKLKATAPKEVWKGGARKQDRWCEECGHRWTTVLPPRFQAELIPFTTTRRG